MDNTLLDKKKGIENCEGKLMGNKKYILMGKMNSTNMEIDKISKIKEKCFHSIYRDIGLHIWCWSHPKNL